MERSLKFAKSADNSPNMIKTWSPISTNWEGRMEFLLKNFMLNVFCKGLKYIPGKQTVGNIFFRGFYGGNKRHLRFPPKIELVPPIDSKNLIITGINNQTAIPLSVASDYTGGSNHIPFRAS